MRDFHQGRALPEHIMAFCTLYQFFWCGYRAMAQWLGEKESLQLCMRYLWKNMSELVLSLQYFRFDELKTTVSCARVAF